MEKPSIITWLISFIKKDIKDFKINEAKKDSIYQKINETEKENE